MYALVTGASSGVGLHYATVLASDYHCDLVLVSNQALEIEQAARTITEEYGVQAVGIYADLSRAEAADEIYRYCREHGIEVDILVNNAGMFYMKRLIEVPVGKIETLLMLHMFTLTKLCRLFGNDMCERHRGYILNMASMTAWMSMPGIQCYNASKAFVLNLSKSLWYELKPYGVSVTVMTPGARIALKKMFKGKKQAMPGLLNRLFVPVINHLPDWAVFAAMKRLPVFR